MPMKNAKRLAVATAVVLAAGAPATAQIAKFHLLTPALPGSVKVERISSAEDVLAGFVEKTASMAAAPSASLGQMRAAASIVAGAGQDIGIDESNASGSDVLSEVASRNRPMGQEPMPRPEWPVLASASEQGHAPTLTSRPEMERQVIVKTRTKTPRSGAKIKKGKHWSVGVFR